MNDSNDLHTGTAPQLDHQMDPEVAAFQLRQGQRYRRTSIIVGVIGLFVGGIGLGIVAFITARHAEAEGVKATAGKVLGVLDLVIGIIVMTIFLGNK